MRGGNKHVQKFNQLVTVYDPDGVELVEKLQSRDPTAVEAHRRELERRRAVAADLTVDELLSESERERVADDPDCSSAEAVARRHRQKLLDRLDAALTAVEETATPPAAEAGTNHSHLQVPAEGLETAEPTADDETRTDDDETTVQSTDSDETATESESNPLVGGFDR